MCVVGFHAINWIGGGVKHAEQDEELSLDVAGLDSFDMVQAQKRVKLAYLLHLQRRPCDSAVRWLTATYQRVYGLGNHSHRNADKKL